MSPKIKDHIIAEKLEETKWGYNQSDDRRFLLDPIGKIFSTFCWDGRPKRVVPQRRTSADEDSKG